MFALLRILIVFLAKQTINCVITPQIWLEILAFFVSVGRQTHLAKSFDESVTYQLPPASDVGLHISDTVTVTFCFE